MSTVSTVKAHKGQRQHSVMKASLYLRRGTNIRMAVNRAVSVELAIMKMLKKACRLSPKLSGRHCDVQ